MRKPKGTLNVAPEAGTPRNYRAGNQPAVRSGSARAAAATLQQGLNRVDNVMTTPDTSKPGDFNNPPQKTR